MGGGTLFFPEASEGQFNCTGVGCQSAGGKGWNLGTTGTNPYTGIGVAASGITGPTATTGPSTRYTPNYVYEDTLTWLKGKHTISTGGTFTYTKTENWNDTVVPNITFGLSSLDPAYNMLTTTSGNFPGGISDTQAGYARNLYGVLTGRVTSVGGTAYLNQDGQYEYLGDRWQLVSQKELGLFISDSWRMKPNLTLTGGVRYELQLPFQADGTSYARLVDWQQVYGITGAGNLFKPGTLAGAAPSLEQLPKGAQGMKTDVNNVAPSIGFTWRPNIGNGFWSKILSSDPVFRGGYSISYSRYATQDFINIYGNNPGASRAATRSTTTGTPLLGFDGFPVLLRDTAKLYPSTFPASPTFPFAPAVNEGIYADTPDTGVPYTHQYSFGWQRELGKSMALEVRYVGNMNVGDWTTWNLNGTANWNFLENGFYNEFRKAQANMQANIAAGLGNNFAYTGAAGTSPLPIFMAYLQGVPLSNTAVNGAPASYTSANFKSSSWYNQLRMYNPSMTGIAGTGTSGLQQPGLAANAATAGLPANFFQANPAVNQGSANLRMSGGNTRYDAIQIDLRRRMSQGLLVGASYVTVMNWKTWTWRTLREDWQYIDSTTGPDKALKFNWVYELPFGHGKPLGGGVSKWVNYIIGGWEWDGQARIQSGQKYNFGGYRLVGMTDKDLQSMFKLRKEVDANGKERYYMFPKDVVDQSIIALNQASATTLSGYSGAAPTGRYLAPASSPDCVQYLGGQCSGTALTRIITGPVFMKYDFAFVKKFQVWGRKSIEARMDLYNVFDNINFNPRYDGSSSLTGWEVNSAARDLNASQDAGGRITSFGLRFSW